MPARKPKLGQNFLIDQAACLRIADALGDLSDRTVVEIGPGHGAITQHLAARAARLHCIELDPSLARELAFRYRGQPSVQVHNADILQTDFAALGEGLSASKIEAPPPLSSAPALLSFRSAAEESASLPRTSKLRPTSPSLDVVGNLPYYITSDILLHLYAAARAGLLGRAVVMMQREVAQRIAAAPGSSDYGALSAFTQMHAHVDELFTLPPTAFDPPPDVHSTVLRLHFAQRFADLSVDPDGFNRFLRSTFAQKRKTLANNLRHAGYTAQQLQDAWPEGLAPQIRSEAATLEEMAALYRSLSAPAAGAIAPAP